MVKIAAVTPNTIAEELELEVGSRIVRINGETVRDAIDYRFLESEESIELEVQSGCGERVVYEIEKDAGEPLGLVLAPDTVRQCANKCVFCFIDGNPDGARQPLYLKDDDFRLSFTYGSYVTLTNLGPRGFQRLIDQRLSPLYVSVHATDPVIRQRMLGVSLGGEIVDQLRMLTAAGIEVHTQIVLCPEWNDGEQLDRTIEDLWAIGPKVLSLSVVPVGLTQYNLNRPIRLLKPEEAARALAQVDRARERALQERGIGWAYAGDEMYFIANAPLPAASFYDDWPLTENGVGSVRRLLDDFDAGIADAPALAGRTLTIVTGTRMGPVIEPLGARIATQTGADVRVIGAENTYFGSTVNTAGLLPARDIMRVLRNEKRVDLVLIPGESLNEDDYFVDDMSLAQLRREFPGATIQPAFELTTALSLL